MSRRTNILDKILTSCYLVRDTQRTLSYRTGRDGLVTLKGRSRTGDPVVRKSVRTLGVKITVPVGVPDPKETPVPCPLSDYTIDERYSDVKTLHREFPSPDW